MKDYQYIAALTIKGDTPSPEIKAHNRRLLKISKRLKDLDKVTYTEVKFSEPTDGFKFDEH
jgi:hypothetical protein